MDKQSIMKMKETEDSVLWWTLCREMEVVRRAKIHEAAIAVFKTIPLMDVESEAPLRLNFDALLVKDGEEMPLAYDMFVHKDLIPKERFRSHSLVDIALFRKVCALVPQIAEMNNMVEHNSIVAGEWNRFKAEREAWCEAHGRKGDAAEPRYNETWDRLVGIQLQIPMKHNPTTDTIMPPLSSSSEDDELAVAHLDAML